ncbi:glutathione S-transferase [Paraglaciecola psychrophila 170]|uniref:Glutathione S-transferase n=1 Tax=Paraglaciecola psychrophila 170 TaxID=1129794 RepID=M4RYP7_9ALTE|nr:glutathione S-transferase [Paraglaciecola psychrophila 170]
MYTGKARAYLIFKGLPYTEVFSSLKVYKNIIVPNTGIRFVPV